VQLDRLDLKAGAPIRKLALSTGAGLDADPVGDVTGLFQPSKPFVFRAGGP